MHDFLPGAREKLLALLSAPSPIEAEGDAVAAAAAAAAASPQQQWSGVLGVVLESAKAQGDWNLAQALVKAGAEIGRLDLHEAIEGGHDRFAAALVDHGAPVDTEDEDQCTPLHIAAKLDSAEIAQRLLQKGADVESPSTASPLSLAAAHGSAAVVEVLMVAGADPHRFTGSSLSPFGEAADKGHDGVLKVMIGLGANVSAVEGDGHTALHVAMGAAVVDVLVEAGADIEARNTEEMTPLMLAAACDELAVGYIEAVRTLVDHSADVNAKDSAGSTALHFASVAAVVDVLVEAGADIEARTDEGMTPLMICAARTFLPARQHVAAVPALVAHGADVNSRDDGGFTALHRAMFAATIDVLVEAGADIEARTDEGMTPLIYAARTFLPARQHVAAVRALVAHGADVNAKDIDGRTALHFAARLVGMIQVRTIHGGGPTLGVVEMAEFLLRSGADELMPDNEGNIPAGVLSRPCWGDEHGEEEEGSEGDDESGEEDVERVRQLFAKAPADRKWRRRGLLLMCMAGNRRDQLPCAVSDTMPGIDTQGASSTGASGDDVVDERSRGGGAGVWGWLAGLRPGQEGTFRKIVGYL